MVGNGYSRYQIDELYQKRVDDINAQYLIAQGYLPKTK